jgi:alkanesulfonate monooxygenase SsuD/methylene tetrahydromethanopterin reductase-like flavin-dependent oxidoreductase (luciferase family)
MIKLALRYDMRAPSMGAAAKELYAACIEQCEWADRLGFETVYLAEHHGAEDGYCPSPMILASAIFARTSNMRVHFSALLAPLHHPIRAAEDLAILDVISNGRVEMTLGLGYRPHEYTMLGVEKSRRVALLEEVHDVLEKAWTGEPFEFRGQTVVVRPAPVQSPRPPIFIGGSTPASAKRAAKRGDNYLPAGDGTLRGIYEEERTRLGLPVPPLPAKGRGPLFLYVSKDPEKDWQIVGPHALYTSQSNAEWAKERGTGGTPYPAAQEVADLQRSSEFKVVTPAECVQLALALEEGSELYFQPIMGGLDPSHAWRSLHLFETEVLPDLVAAGVRPARSVVVEAAHEATEETAREAARHG